MVSRKRQENFVDKHDVFEVVDHALAVEEVHGRSEEVPVERLCEPQAPRSRRHVGNRNDLLVANNLHGGHDDEHVDVAREHGAEEEGDHDDGPDGTCDEGLLLLFRLRELLDRWLVVVGCPACRSICAVLFEDVAIPRGTLREAVRAGGHAAGRHALFCGRVGVAASTGATLAMLELDVLFGLGHDCESVGCRIWPSEEATVGRLENLRLR